MLLPLSSEIPSVYGLLDHLPYPRFIHGTASTSDISILTTTYLLMQRRTVLLSRRISPGQIAFTDISDPGADVALVASPPSIIDFFLPFPPLFSGPFCSHVLLTRDLTGVAKYLAGCTWRVRNNPTRQNISGFCPTTEANTAS